MKRLISIALVSAAAALAAIGATGATGDASNPVERVVPQGKDGDLLFYQVKCTDNTQASVVIDDKRKRICAQGFGKDQVCRKHWTIQAAAEEACR